MKILLYLGFISLLLSCGVRSNSGSSGFPKKRQDKFYISYYKNNNLFTYFVKPIRFNFEKYKLDADFTFVKRSDTILDLVTLNYSIYSDYKLSDNSIQKILLDTLNLPKGDFLFCDSFRGTYQIRYSTKISPQTFQSISSKSTFYINTVNQVLHFKAHSLFSKKSLDLIPNI